MDYLFIFWINKDLKVGLYSDITYGSKYTFIYSEYIMVPGKLRNITQLRTGITYINTFIDLDDDIAKDFTAINVNNSNETFTYGVYGMDVDNSSIYNVETMMKQAILNAGIGFKKITNLVITTDYYKAGNFSNNAKMFDFYGDILFAPVITYANVFTLGGKEWKLETNNYKRIGWRAGYSQRLFYKTKFTYRFEMGQRPGYSANRLYAFLSVGISIPSNVKIFK